MNSPYSATPRSNTSRNFIANFGSDVNAFISYLLKTNRDKTKRLEFETSIGSSIIKLLVQNVIGRGLMPQSSPVNEVLNWKDNDYDKFTRNVEAYFRLTTDSDIDYYGKNSFTELQRIAYKCILSSGDILLHRSYFGKEKNYKPFIQLIDGACLSNPGGESDTKDITGGIKFKNNIEIGYYLKVTDANRLDTFETQYVNRFSKTGFKEFDLVYIDGFNPSQARGVPILTAVREDLLDVISFKNSYLAKAIVQTILSAFITKQKATSDPSFSEKIMNTASPENEDSSEIADERNDVALGTGNIIELNEGEDIKTIESAVAGVDFDSFIKSNLQSIGSAVNLPYEMLMQSYNASFSASRATIAGAEKGFEILRAEISGKICRPVWEQVLDYGFRIGDLDPPEGYFENELIRKAVLQAYWTGPSPITIDPQKEVNAWKTAIASRLASREQAVNAMYGRDWDNVNDRLITEEKRLGGSEDE